MIRWTKYHSLEWMELVEQGWITVCVDDWLDQPFGKHARIATMLYHPPRCR